MALSKILVMMTCWEGDRHQAQKLAQFLADMEPSHSDKADFLLVERFDCKPWDHNVVEALKRKFNLFQHHGRLGNVGWPMGCNDLFLAGMEWAYGMIEARKVLPYKAIFNVESDGAPICRNWIQRLHEAWDEANKETRVCMAGALIKTPEQPIKEHINANALISADLKFLHWVTRSSAFPPPHGGWDYVLAPKFKEIGWANVPGIRSYWNSRTCEEREYQVLLTENVIWCHGVKDDSLLKWGRKYIL
jgi:hypothetical protein